jgi:HAD superfamily hydrolase (TIGR01509 family)
MWTEAKPDLYQEVFGQDMYAKIGNPIGLGIDTLYELAAVKGSTVSRQTLVDAFHSRAPHIYQTAPITPGLDRLVDELKSRGYRLGIVSASPKSWIKILFKRLPFAREFDVVLSLQERADLPHKPEPHGYLEAMKDLGAIPAETIILEDSNTGIAAAKASGGFTIGLRENLMPGEEQTGADAYADTIDDVIKMLK